MKLKYKLKEFNNLLLGKSYHDPKVVTRRTETDYPNITKRNKMTVMCSKNDQKKERMKRDRGINDLVICSTYEPSRSNFYTPWL
ncbi:hypothetical protein KPH14_004529 [Odynerus spinipes]|uniref:Uncharacterized protein n=1 Tax=Odynerus spinipes TaxID=1348599 RepID=A0AAD9RLX2_9HYME|nr:hypothetical protein KPH14_004529 [Odynerus spinipes]